MRVRPLYVISIALLVAAALVAVNQYRVAQKRRAAVTVEDAVKARRQALLDELRPVTLSNCVLTRVGGAHDGGYVMCGNLMQGTQTAYSYGIGGNDDWGCSISVTQKVPVHQYDCFEPTQLTCKGGTFKLNAECVGPRQEILDGRPFDTIVNQFARNGDTGKTKIVKIDIEGAEWATILATPDEVFNSITQMPMELHGTDNQEVLDGLRKLKQHFHLVSVHFNNFACSDRFAPVPSWAYQVLLVNKKIGVVGPPPPESPALASVMAPDNPAAAECVYK